MEVRVKDERQYFIVAAFAAVVAFAAYMMVNVYAQSNTASGDFRNAAVAEVHDAQGQAVLRGQFTASPEDDDDIERKATLEPTGLDADASGEAEVEFDKAGATEQELEFSVKNLLAGGTFTFVIDGVTIATATADRRGHAEVEIVARLP
jgi:hypothetical protein